MNKTSSKKDIDRHVVSSLSRLSDKEKNLRGYCIAKLYFKANEYECALQWLLKYIGVKDEHSDAHKLLGQCYEKLKKPDRAITSYQRSLQLNSKQKGLIANICRLLLEDESLSSNSTKAKYWCELAETENVTDEAVLSLKLKVINKDNKNDSKPLEELILKEITSRPTDISLRIRLVKFLVEEKRYNDAFKYCFDIEMKFMDNYLQSIEWYTTISTVLSQYTNQAHWNYWCLHLISLDRQIYLNLKRDLSLYTTKQTNIKEVTTLLFEFDQVLKNAADTLIVLAPVKELAEELINHFRGQLALHIASLMFKKQKISNLDQWRETTKKCLPVLLFAFQCNTVNLGAFWLKNTNEVIRNLFGFLKKEGAFRCAQASRTILSCLFTSDNENLVITKNRQVTNNKRWNTVDDIFNQIRQQCSDSHWRETIYRLLFTNSDQQSKILTSYYVQNNFFEEPKYEFATFAEIQNYEDIAQHLYPASLEHQVYLGMGRTSLQTFKSQTFSGLNLSTSNLINCNPETINQIDIDSFLYCSIVQAKRHIESEKQCYEVNSSKPSDKPSMLPAANMVDSLCSEEQIDWWTAAYKIYKNISGDNLAQLKATLQFGIEAVRGVDSPKVDLIILLKLGEVLLKRSRSSEKMDEKRHLEFRVESIYKFSLKMLRNKNSDNLRRIFNFNSLNYNVDREVDKLAEDAVTYLAGIYFKKGEFKECIEDFNGLVLPFASYFKAEAYKKLDELIKTPKKNKKIYMEKTRENLMDTLNLLESNDNFDRTHPLHSIIQSELKRLQFSTSEDMGSHNNSLNGGITDEEVFQDAFSSSFRNRREAQFSQSIQHQNIELENLIRKLSDVVLIVKDDVLMIRNDVSDIKDRLDKIEENLLSKKSTPSEDDAATAEVLNDMYMAMEEMNPNYLNLVQQGASGQQLTPTAQAARYAQNANMQASYNQMFNTAYPMYMQYGANQMMQRPGAPQIPGISSPLPYQDLANDFRASLLMTSQNALYQQQMQQQQLQQQIQQQMPPIPTQNIQPAVQQQQPFVQPAAPAAPKSALIDALSTPSLLNTWNNTYNQQQSGYQLPLMTQPPPPVQQIQQQPIVQNQPFVKQPPVNVVITSSDPLPAQNTFVTQPAMSVTIPIHHIKHGNAIPSSTFAPTFQQNKQDALNKAMDDTINAVAVGTKTQTKPLYENVSPSKNEDGLLVEPADYDPCPDFKPIIALPDEIEVKTGEENEEILFSERSKLFRFVEKEWKERGIGNIKILKNKDTNKCRILMRREQIHKLCANHAITPDIILNKTDKENSYIWMAHDFSEDKVVVEKFLVRFKAVDLAKKFYEKFEEAKKIVPKAGAVEVVPTKPKENKSSNGIVTPTIATPSITSAPSQQAPKPADTVPKSTFTFGGLSTGTTTTTSSIFSSPKPAADKVKEAEKEKGSADKPNPFSTFSFGQGNASNKSFSELFGNVGVKNDLNSSPAVASQSTPNKEMNRSGHEEDEDHYEPTATFVPVIALPELIEAKTGEENENVMFEYRAKLLRYDTTTKEWKERGVGIMKVLVDKKDPNKARLLMRRDQIFKLCCNQLISKDLKISKMPKSETALTWYGPDFSENEIRNEMLAIRFKTKDLSKNFHDAVLEAQSNMGEVKEVKEVKKDTTKKEEAKGFGDQFKPKVGSWNCEACYITNKADSLYCCACESPKDNTVAKKEPAKGLLTLSADAPKFSFGMPAVNSAPTVNAVPAVTSFADKPSFSFSSFKAVNTPAVVPDQTKSIVSDKKKEGFGDQFKPKAGSWNCEACYISNKADALYCCACESPKDNTVAKKEPAKGLLTLSADAPKFSFGVQPQNNATNSTPIADKPAIVTSSFSFGSPAAAAPANTVKAPSVTTFGAATPTSAFSFGSQKTFAFGANNITKMEDKTPAEVIETNDAKAALGQKDTFNFVFKKKSPGKSKSPGKTRNDSVNDDEADQQSENEYHEEEENQTYFTPVIALPDKIEVKTGEEDEELLYSHRAKLFRYTEGEWKERGLGDVKVLKHRVSGKLRVLMRREQIFKLCLNHILTADIEYKKKDDKSWMFVTNDFSDGEIEAISFCIRFKSQEIAEEFKSTIDMALLGQGSEHTDGNSAGNLELIKKLQLPADFYDNQATENKCAGCRGCKSEDFIFPSYKATENVGDENSLPLKISKMKIKPIKKNIEDKKSVSFSLYDNKENEKVKELFSGTGKVKDLTVDKKESSIFSAGIKKSEGATNIFGGFGGNNSFGSPSAGNIFGNTSSSIFGAKSPDANSGSSIFSSSLNTTPAPVTTAQTSTPTETIIHPATTLFGSMVNQSPATESNSGGIFGNKSSFSFANNTGGSIFGGNKENSGNAFPSFNNPPNSQPVFGSATFGSATTFGNATAFGNATPFGNTPVFSSTAANENPVRFGFVQKDTSTKSETTGNIFGGSGGSNTFSFANAIKDLNKSSDGAAVPDFINKESGPTFAGLATATSPEKGFGSQAAPAGGFFGLTIKEDVFSKLARGDDVGTENNESNNEDNYDPHYEPIISLPDEIKVSTGEEDEQKIFGDRAKLYRYDTTTKEWKERGVGELKILHHPTNGTYRLLLRREQIFKLVLNQLISDDFSMSMMNNSGKAFCWGGMNYAEGAGSSEQLAVRFKNEDLAAQFKAKMEECLSKIGCLDPKDD